MNEETQNAAAAQDAGAQFTIQRQDCPAKGRSLSPPYQVGGRIGLHQNLGLTQYLKIQVVCSSEDKRCCQNRLLYGPSPLQ